MYPSGIRKHLYRVHPEIVGKDAESRNWEKYCKVAKPSERTKIEYKSIDNSQENSVKHESGRNSNSRVGSKEMGVTGAADILKHGRSADGVVEENQELEQLGREVVKRKRCTKDAIMFSELAHANKGEESVSSNLENSLRKPKMKSRAKRNKKKLQLQRAHEPTFFSQPVYRPETVPTLTPCASTQTPADAASKLPNAETNGILSKALPAAGRTRFRIERLSGKFDPRLGSGCKSGSSAVPAPLDFAARLVQAQIDKNKLISVTKPLQSILAKTKVSAAESVKPDVSGIATAANDLPVHPSIVQHFAHVHNEFCGHIRVLHDGHMDYLVNGVLQHVDRDGNVYPHKLGATEKNPAGCRPVGEQGQGAAEELVTPHVLLRGSVGELLEREKERSRPAAEPEVCAGRDPACALQYLRTPCCHPR